ncbi:MAG: metal ABC transporter substrate-binding protein [Pseudomonadota bacterium]
MKSVTARLALLVTVGIAATAASAQDGPRVVAVNYPIQYFAERLLGEAGDVVFPVPADVDPSFWRPGISDISLVQGADLILLNGAGFATWVDRVSLPRSRTVVTGAALEGELIVTESITHSHGDGGEHSHEGLATYTWLDPSLASVQAEAIAGALSTRGLAAEEDVAERLASLQAELESFDEVTRDALSPLNGASVIATHPRYHYFERRYGLSITSLEWEAGAMPSEDELADLAEAVADTGAQILIWEAAPPAEAVEAVSALGLQSVVFPPLAHAPAEGSIFESLTASVTALAAAAQGAGN